MNLITVVGRSIFNPVITIISFALLTQIATAQESDQLLHSYKQVVQPCPSPISTDSNVIATIENLISQLQETIEHMYSSSKNNIPLENFDRLQKITIDLQGSMDSLKNDLRGIENAYNKTTHTTNKLNKALLLNSIVQNIQSRQFSLAGRQLQLNDEIKYEDVVEALYKHNDSNFDLLQSFSGYISSAEDKLKFFETLFNQMKSTGHQDILKLIQLHQFVKKEVLGDKANVTSAQLLVSHLEDEIQTTAIESISAGFLNDNSWQSIYSFSTALFDKFPQFVPNICNEVIDKISNRLDPQKIINEANKINHLESEMLILQVVFDKLESKKELNTNFTLSLAHRMKVVMDRYDYQNISPQVKTSFESMRKKLPESLRNLVFSSEICIKNPLYEQYLYASEDEQGGYNNDDERRSVYTGVPNNETEISAFKWRVDFTDDDQIILYNKKFNEKLFGCYFIRYNQEEERRMAYTFNGSPYGPGKGSMTWWSPEVDGDALQLKNYQTDEYLFADHDRKEDDNRRYVFTYTPGGRLMGSQWEIIDCSTPDEPRFNFEESQEEREDSGWQIIDCTTELPNLS